MSAKPKTPPRTDQASDVALGAAFFSGGEREHILDILPHLGYHQHYFTLVTGEPGAGKTRLKQELQRRFARTANPCIELKMPVGSFEAQEEDWLDLLAAQLGLLPGLSLEGVAYEMSRKIADKAVVRLLLDDADQVSFTCLGLLVRLSLVVSNANFQVIGFATQATAFRLQQYLEQLGIYDQVYELSLPRLDLEQTRAFLRFYLNANRLAQPISNLWAKQIYEASGGLIGDAAECAYQYLASLQKKRPKPYVPTRHLFAALSLLMLVGLLLWISPHNQAPSLLQVNHGAGLESDLVKVNKAPELKVTFMDAKGNPIQTRFLKAPVVESSDILAVADQQVSLQSVQVKEADVLPLVNEMAAISPIEKPLLDELGLHRDWLLSLPSSIYTLQVLGGSNQASIRSFLERYGYLGDMGYYRTQYKGQDWFVVVHGVFENFNQAEKAIDDLPESLQRSKPWVRSLQDIQAAVR